MQKIVFFLQSSSSSLWAHFEHTHTHGKHSAQSLSFGNYAKSAAGYTRRKFLFTIPARFYRFNLYFAINSLAKFGIGEKEKENSLSQTFNHVQTQKVMEIDACFVERIFIASEMEPIDGGELVSRTFEYYVNRLNVCTLHEMIFSFRIWMGMMKLASTDSNIVGWKPQQFKIHSEFWPRNPCYVKWNETSESHSVTIAFAPFRECIRPRKWTMENQSAHQTQFFCSFPSNAVSANASPISSSWSH